MALRLSSPGCTDADTCHEVPGNGHESADQRRTSLETWRCFLRRRPKPIWKGCFDWYGALGLIDFGRGSGSGWYASTCLTGERKIYHAATSCRGQDICIEALHRYISPRLHVLFLFLFFMDIGDPPFPGERVSVTPNHFHWPRVVPQNNKGSQKMIKWKSLV